MTNILNGITKYNYLVENRDGFEATEQDYEEMRSIFETIISTWGDIDIKELSESAQKRALTPAQRRVFNAIDDQPGLTGPQLAEEVDEEGMGWIISKLIEYGLVVKLEREDGEKVLHPYWTKRAKNESDDVII